VPPKLLAPPTGYSAYAEDAGKNAQQGHRLMTDTPIRAKWQVRI
jgi:hypothetical protein